MTRIPEILFLFALGLGAMSILLFVIDIRYAIAFIAVVVAYKPALWFVARCRTERQRLCK